MLASAALAHQQDAKEKQRRTQCVEAGASKAQIKMALEASAGGEEADISARDIFEFATSARTLGKVVVASGDGGGLAARIRVKPLIDLSSEHWRHADFVPQWLKDSRRAPVLLQEWLASHNDAAQGACDWQAKRRKVEALGESQGGVESQDNLSNDDLLRLESEAEAECTATLERLATAAEQREELVALERLLKRYGTLSNVEGQVQALEESLRAARLREHRFHVEPLLRRRKLEEMDERQLQVLVVALQNELSACYSFTRHCNLISHPIIQNVLATVESQEDKRVFTQPAVGTHIMDLSKLNILRPDSRKDILKKEKSAFSGLGSTSKQNRGSGPLGVKQSLLSIEEDLASTSHALKTVLNKLDRLDLRLGCDVEQEYTGPAHTYLEQESHSNCTRRDSCYIVNAVPVSTAGAAEDGAEAPSTDSRRTSTSSWERDTSSRCSTGTSDSSQAQQDGVLRTRAKIAEPGTSHPAAWIAIQEKLAVEQQCKMVRNATDTIFEIKAGLTRRVSQLVRDIKRRDETIEMQQDIEMQLIKSKRETGAINVQLASMFLRMLHHCYPDLWRKLSSSPLSMQDLGGNANKLQCITPEEALNWESDNDTWLKRWIKVLNGMTTEEEEAAEAEARAARDETLNAFQGGRKASTNGAAGVPQRKASVPFRGAVRRLSAIKSLADQEGIRRAAVSEERQRIELRLAKMAQWPSKQVRSLLDPLVARVAETFPYLNECRTPQMLLEGVLEFAFDSNLVPNLLSQHQCGECFGRAQVRLIFLERLDTFRLENREGAQGAEKNSVERSESKSDGEDSSSSDSEGQQEETESAKHAESVRNALVIWLEECSRQAFAATKDSTITRVRAVTNLLRGFVESEAQRMAGEVEQARARVAKPVPKSSQFQRQSISGAAALQKLAREESDRNDKGKLQGGQKPSALETAQAIAGASHKPHGSPAARESPRTKRISGTGKKAPARNKVTKPRPLQSKPSQVRTASKLPRSNNQTHHSKAEGPSSPLVKVSKEDALLYGLFFRFSINASGATTNNMAFDDINRNCESISRTGLLQFFTEFQIMPELITKRHLLELLNTLPTRLSFEQYKQLLVDVCQADRGRAALSSEPFLELYRKLERKNLGPGSPQQQGKSKTESAVDSFQILLATFRCLSEALYGPTIETQGRQMYALRARVKRVAQQNGVTDSKTKFPRDGKSIKQSFPNAAGARRPKSLSELIQLYY